MAEKHKCNRPRMFLDKNKVVELFSLEIVSYIRLKWQKLNTLNHREDQVTGGEVSSELPKFRGQRPPKEIHITN